jgi:hypothetical protein
MDRKTFLRMAATLAGGIVGLPLTRHGVAAAPAPGHLAGRFGQASAEGDEAFWAFVRGQFVLDPEWSYLNMASVPVRCLCSTRCRSASGPKSVHRVPATMPKRGTSSK